MDLPPRFPLPRNVIIDPAEQEAVNYTVVFKLSLARLRLVSLDLEDIIEALEYIAGVAAYINRRATDANFWGNDLQTARLLMGALHKVLSLPRMKPEDFFS